MPGCSTLRCMPEAIASTTSPTWPGPRLLLPPPASSPASASASMPLALALALAPGLLGSLPVLLAGCSGLSGRAGSTMPYTHTMFGWRKLRGAGDRREEGG